MAAVYSRSDAGTEFSPPSRKRRIYVTNVDIERIKQESAQLDAMGALGSPTAPNGTPLLERLLQLEQHMDVLEQKYSPRGLAADFCSPSSPSSLCTPSSLERRCRCAKSVLLETEAKGTLVERIQSLEKRISQHSMDLEKTFSSGRFSSSRSEPSHGESDHIRALGEPEHLESPSHRDSWRKEKETDNSQETYNNNLEVLPTPNLPSEKHGSAEPKHQTEDAATREMDPELEDEPLTPSPTVEAQTEEIPEGSAGANEGFEAEAAGKTMNDDNAVRKSKFEETPASATSTSTDSASTNSPTEAVETEHVDEKNDTGELKEQPKVELVQNEFHSKKDGGVAKDLLHYRSLDEPLGKFQTDFVEESPQLPLKEWDDKLDEQSEALALVTAQVPEYAIQFMKKEMRRKQSFKHIRERIQRFFGLKEADNSPSKDTSQPHRFGSKETDSATKGTSRLHRFGSKETDSATKGTSRLHRFGSKETDSTTKGTSRSISHRFGSKETDSATKGTSRSISHRFGSKETDSATKGTSRSISHRFGSKETDSATKGTSRPHRFGSSIL